MPVVWQAEAHLVLCQSEHRSRLVCEFLLMQCSVGMSPYRMALALGYCLLFGPNPSLVGPRSVRQGTSHRGFLCPLWFHKWKEKPFHLERPWKQHTDLTESVQTCPLLINALPATGQPCGEWCTTQRSWAECCCFLHHQLLFPSDNRGAENTQHYGSLFINCILQSKHWSKATADSLWFVCIFEKCTLCLLGIMFLNVPFSVLSESYSLHSYTSQYFPIAIETACEESTGE